METAEVIDRISNLPDELLLVILSLLPIKDAFSTILLSKRWTSLCKLLPGRYCNDKSVKDEGSFSHFYYYVEDYLFYTKVIKTFHVHCESRFWNKCRFNIIEYWIQIAKQHPLENLHLSSRPINLDDKITLPPTIFTFPTLVVLKLTEFCLDDNISVDLPLLKTLHLNIVFFKNRENFDKLLYGCPILEDLIAHVCFNDSFTLNTREPTTLSNLIRAEIDCFSIPFTTISNVQYLKHDVRVNFPSQDIYPDCKTFQNLIHLELLIHGCFMPHVVASKRHHYLENVMGLLHNCPKLQILSISKWISEHFFGVWKYPNNVPKCISSQLKSCTINFCNLVVDLQLTRYILKNAALLEDMKIRIVDLARERANAIQELTLYPRISPKCKISISGTSL